MKMRTVLSVVLSIPVVVACTYCPNSKYGDLIASIPPVERKNGGTDLKGWVFKKIISKSSGHTHYYYHLPSFRADKPTFVLIHGMFLDGRTFLNFGRLAEHYNLIAYDLPFDSPFYTGKRADFSVLLSDFFDEMNIESVTLGGVSLGGRIAMAFFEHNKDVALEGLVLISTDIPKTKSELKTDQRSGRLILRLTGGKDEKLICLVKKLSDRQKRKRDTLRPSVFEIFSIKQPSFYKQVLNMMTSSRDLVKLNLIKCPTLIIHGDEDTTVSIGKARGLLDHIPQARFVSIPKGDHGIVYSHADVLLENIITHLRPLSD